MSSNSSTPTPASEQDPAPSTAPSFIDKVKRFTRENQLLVIIGAGLLGLLVLFLVLYFVFVRASRMERFADEFCACTEQVQGDFFNESKDGFAYHSQLVPCFAEGFSQYGDRFNKPEKRILLEEFQQAVVEKCPQKLNSVLHFEAQ